MPIYEYQCNHCAHQLEVFHKNLDERAPECPKCQNDSLNRLISSTSFQLKGGGWYVTDFKDKKPKSEGASSDNSVNKSSDAKSKASQTPKSSAPSKSTASKES